MIEGFPPNALVIVNLISPKEKFFGVLRALSPAGVTMRAVNLDSFDDWIHQIARAEEAEIEMVTMFVPLFRVERIFLDESAGHEVLKFLVSPETEHLLATAHGIANLQICKNALEEVVESEDFLFRKDVAEFVSYMVRKAT